MESNQNLPLEDCYDIINSVAGGTCGDVLKGRDKKTGEIVAMKRIKNLHPEAGFPMNAMKEIKLLQELKHENIINLRKVCVSNSMNANSVYLIFDYCEYDLQGLMSLKKLTLKEVKCYMRQLMKALNLCCQNNYIHRDLKPANLLLTSKNVVKLADFGLVKKIDLKKNADKRPPTTKVITIWYRPPELLLATTSYSLEIDIWSAGCILYEMITGEVLFRSLADNDIDELTEIFKICGIPDDNDWKGWSELPNAKIVKDINLSRFPKSTLKQYLDKKIPAEFEEAKDLILKMLQYDPKKRPNAQEVLDHPFLSKNFEDFLPEKLEPLSFPDAHQFHIETKKKYNKKIPQKQRPKL